MPCANDLSRNVALQKDCPEGKPQALRAQYKAKVTIFEIRRATAYILYELGHEEMVQSHGWGSTSECKYSDSPKVMLLSPLCANTTHVVRRKTPSLIPTQEATRHQCGWFHWTSQPNLDSDIHEKDADRWQEIQTRGWWLYLNRGSYWGRCWYRAESQRAACSVIFSVMLYRLQCYRGKILSGLEDC